MGRGEGLERRGLPCVLHGDGRSPRALRSLSDAASCGMLEVHGPLLDLCLHGKAGGGVNHDLEEICRQAAEGISGAKAFSGGGIMFQRRGFEARVDFVPGSMDILFDTRDLAVESIQVSPAGLWHDVKELFGRKDFQIGDADFDSDFEIHASGGEFAPRVLDPQIRSVLRSAKLFGTYLWRLSP